MKTVACANGAFDERERSLLATAPGLFGTAHDVDALAPIAPEELAAHAVDPKLREPIVRGTVLPSLVDGEATRDEAAVVDGGGRRRSWESREIGARDAERRGEAVAGAPGRRAPLLLYHLRAREDRRADPAEGLRMARADLAFHAGCRREEKDPFSFLMFGIAEFHLGLAMSPVAKASRGWLDAPTLLAALQSGVACTIDPTDGWDPWPVMARPLDELCAAHRIAPL
jgi:hypothetical protein